MNMFSLALSSFSVLYIVLGFKIFLMNKSLLLNRLFLAINLSLFIWSFASALYISAHTLEACIFWYKVSSVGCFIFIGLILHYFLEYTRKEELLKKWWIYVLLYLPCVVFSYMEIAYDFYAEAYSLGSNGWIIGTRKKIHIQVEKWASRAFLKGFVEIGCQEELPQNPHWELR